MKCGAQRQKAAKEMLYEHSRIHVLLLSLGDVGTQRHTKSSVLLFYYMLIFGEREGKIAEADYHDARWKYLPTKMKNFVRREKNSSESKCNFFTDVPFFLPTGEVCGVP